MLLYESHNTKSILVHTEAMHQHMGYAPVHSEKNVAGISNRKIKLSFL